MMQPLHQQQSGFTLIETLVAITILLIIIAGPMKISMTTAKSTSYASEQVVAFFLAQEGAELAQAARDKFLLGRFQTTSGDPWNDFKTGGTYDDCFTDTNPNGCGIKLATDLLGTISTVDCTTDGSACRLYYDGSSGAPVRQRYNYDGTGTTTPYTRIITFEKVGNDVKVVSEVTWRTGNLRAKQTVKVETYLLDKYAGNYPL